MATINDVAQEAGVSPTTVSRYLNGRIELPASTSGRIDAAIKRLDYRPNLLAKRLSTGRTETIGIVAPEIANPFFADLAAAIEDEAEQHGYSVLMSSTRGATEREIACLRRLDDRHVDGLIMMTNRPDDGRLAASMSAHASVVLVDEDVPGVAVPKIFVENAEGAYQATRYLIGAGHRRIAHIGGPVGLMSAQERKDGFLRAMREAGLEPTHILQEAYSREFGAAAMADILSSADRPTAVFAGSDFIAIGAMQVIRDHGLNVPKDISLVGFDDMPFADMLAPGLTTVRQPTREMGRKAFRALFGLLNNQDVADVERLPVELVERHSVAKII
ncbi:LacI family DNA-binding transcriptional regulator [Mesorhizobium sp. KR1-2]|uniref:LacI family DNA-binding transcriptional regulator n=1 Tax=Mesorhizobium sp. KR1-2 TaxID=3156609 RepID=UPI0032B49E97